MEGNYLPKQSRQKFANENKRTHFKLGDYIPETDGKKSQNFDRPVSANSLAGMMRATHFGLGTDKPVTASESKSRFLPIEVSKTPYVVPDVSIDLRKTHYSLGSYKGTPSSTARTNMAVKGEKAPVIMTNEFAVSHHFQYGNDKPSHLSIFKVDYTKKNSQEGSKEEADQLKKELQKTHFKVGNEKPDYSTNNKIDFKAKKISNEKGYLDLQKEHFKLGTDKPNYFSISRSSQNIPKTPKQCINEDTMKDLRKSHFLLGSSQSEYTKTSQDFKGNHGDTQDPVKDAVLRKTNFVLGTNEKAWKSTYKDSHSSSAKSLAVSTRDRNTDKASHFTLGNSKQDLVSVHRADFLKFDHENKGDDKWGEYLRKHHFEMGVSKANYECQNTKYGKEKFQNPERSNELMNDLRKTHFALGNDKNDMVSINKKDFKGKKGEGTAEGEKMHGKHSYRDGTGKFYDDTEHKSRFNWVKPMPDNKFKFLFD